MLSKIENALNDPRMTSLNCHKYPVYTEYSPEAQISLLFALRSLVFHIIEVFGFPLGYNGEFKKILKNQKLKIAKIPKSNFVRPIQKIQKKFQNIL